MCYFRIWDTETGECKRIIEEEEYITGCGYVSSFFFPLGIPFRLVGLFPLSYRFNEKYLVTGCCGQVKIWDLEALIDFQNDDSHPFLLTTLPVTVFDRINYILLNS